MEIWAHLPSLQTVIIKLAVSLMPAAEQSRWDEEWHAYLLQVTGELCRTRAAFGFLMAGLYAYTVSVFDSALRWIPIIDERKWGAMLLTDIAKTIEASSEKDAIVKVTTLHGQTKKLANGESMTIEFSVEPLHGLTDRQMMKELHLSPAIDPWQLSKPVKWLRTGYSRLRYNETKPIVTHFAMTQQNPEEM